MAPAFTYKLAPKGVLRAAINLSNPLLVSGTNSSGEPIGVAPSLASTIAEQLGLPLEYVTFLSPSSLAAVASDDIWDIGFIGAEPRRAEKISFTSAYAEIEATYAVARDSRFASITDIDCPGVRIGVSAGTAYDLWLERNIQFATLVHCHCTDEASSRFKLEELDVLAGLRPELLDRFGHIANVRVLPDRFTAVQQAIGMPKHVIGGMEFLNRFVRDAKASGIVAHLISEFEILGLYVAR